MSLKSSVYAAAAMAMLASQGSVFMEGYSSVDKPTSKTPLTAKQKKVRKANKKAGKSRAKNRRK